MRNHSCKLACKNTANSLFPSSFHGIILMQRTVQVSHKKGEGTKNPTNFFGIVMTFSFLLLHWQTFLQFITECGSSPKFAISGSQLGEKSFHHKVTGRAIGGFFLPWTASGWPRSSKTPRDGDMSMEIGNRLPIKDLERRRCTETNVLINYYKQK